MDYGLTAATYDRRNLPTIQTAGGVTSTYRYNGSGQRISKQVGSGDTEYYILEGPLTLGVFTLDGSGSVTGWHFNLEAGGAVVGRETEAGDRYYYHTDLLGSTRTVVDDAGTAVEGYFYYPFGLLSEDLSPNTGATKEGFTGNEVDAESGLQYFGARYYMPALTRWGQADPLADRFASWTPYNYVLGNPARLTDPDGNCPVPIESCAGRGGLDLAAGLTPGVSTGHDAVVLATGYNAALGERAGLFDRAAAAIGLLTPLSGPIARNAARGLGDLISGAVGRLLGKVDEAATGRRGGLDPGTTFGRPGRLDDHFDRHGADFGAESAEDYANQASDFLTRTQAEGLPTKIGEDGVIRTYDASSNTFGAYNPDGTTRTFFKPRSGQAYWHRQPGQAPATPGGS